MAYFSNGCEGDSYQEEYCNRCVHSKGPRHCPVWTVHLLYAYKLCNEEDTPAKVMLDMLIPMAPNGLFADECAMFHQRQPDD